MSMFAPATKSQSRARVAIIGPSGGGKTYTGLILATTLAQGGKVAVIDTEKGSASKYADIFKFDVCELTDFDPDKYVEAIGAAQKAGYAAILIDSLSHAWSGAGGALEQVDNAMDRNRGNKFTAWKDVTPKHNSLINAMLQSTCHVVATMRSKMEYIIEEDERGKKVPRKVGLAPVQREGMEYEFDVVGDIDIDHKLIISKTRCPELDRAIIHKPGRDMGNTLLRWLGGAPKPATAEPAFTPPAPVAPATPPPAPKSRSSAEIIASKTSASDLTKWLLGVQDKMPVSDNVDKWKNILFECDEHASAQEWSEPQRKSVDAMLIAIKTEIERCEMDAAVSAAAVDVPEETQDEVPA